MDFNCFLCFKSFNTVENTIQHLKNIHQLRNNAQDLKCLAKSDNCTKKFKTFDALKKHSLQCTELNVMSNIVQKVCSFKKANLKAD